MQKLKLILCSLSLMMFFIVDLSAQDKSTSSEKFSIGLGIDIESIRDRILKIKHKFISDNENQFLSSEKDYLEQLYVLWSAKESLFKLYGKGNLDFRKNLHINNFNFKNKGEISGKIIINDYLHLIKLYYEKIEDHILVYCLDPK